MTDVTESSEHKASVKEDFFDRFRQAQAALQTSIDLLRNTTTSESTRANLVDQCLSNVSRLSNDVKDASGYLPAHDQRTYSTAVKKLAEELQRARSTSAPERKFAFKKSAPRTKNTSSNTDVVEAAHMKAHHHLDVDTSLPMEIEQVPHAKKQLQEVTSASGNVSNAASTDNSTTIEVTFLSSTHYVLDVSALQSASSALLSNIHHSLVDISISASLARPLATLAIKSVTKSLLLCGSVSGAAHITAVQDSTLVIWSRQVRMHECRNCVVYLRSASRPIIEDCESISFAPLPDILDSEMPDSPNLWDQVDDFRWLKAGPSPHWSVLTSRDDRYIDKDTWDRIIVSQKPLLDLDDLLTAAKII